MAKVDIDFDGALAGYAELQQALNDLRGDVKNLGTDAENAGMYLQDDVSKKYLQQIKELVKQMEKILSGGEERVRELERLTKQDKARCHELEL